MTPNIDPLIQSEFDRLGLNIVENEGLADLIIEKVRRQRLRRLLIIAITSAAAILGALLLFIFATQVFKSSSDPVQIVHSSSISEPANADGSLALPQFVVLEVDATKASGRNYAFNFDIKSSQNLEMISEVPDLVHGLAGTIDVYKVNPDNSKQHFHSFDLGAGTFINDFGVPVDSQYQVVFRFSDPNFKGRVRIAFLLSK